MMQSLPYRYVILILPLFLCGCVTHSHRRLKEPAQPWDARIPSIDFERRAPSDVLDEIRQFAGQSCHNVETTVIVCPPELPDKWPVPMPGHLTDVTTRAVLENVAVGLDRTCIFLGSVAFLVGNIRYVFLPIAFEGRVSDAGTDRPIGVVDIDPASWLLPPRICVNDKGEFHATLFVEIRYFVYDGAAILLDDLANQRIPVRFLSDGYSPATAHVTVSGDEHSFQEYAVKFHRAITEQTGLDRNK